MNGPRRRHPALGYALVLAAVTMWSLNASISRSLLEDGLDAARLAEVRSVGAWVVLVIALALFARRGLAVRRDQLPLLALIGIGGFAAVYVTYFVAIERLQIGAALTLQYLAPLLLLLWLRLVRGSRLSPGLWAAAAISLVGSALVVRAYDPGSLDTLGVIAGLGAAASFAIYLAGSERAGRRHPAHVTLLWAFGFATLFWLLVQPPWTFPFEELASTNRMLMAAAVVLVGTLLPFGFMVAALRHVPAARAAVVATLEPALSALFAFAIHDEGLAALQLAGIAIVVAAVAWVQAQRPDLTAESFGP